MSSSTKLYLSDVILAAQEKYVNTMIIY